MTDHDTVDRWVRDYRTAWESNLPDDIRGLFTPDAEYFTGPFDDPWRGHDDIVAKWLEAADQPGDTEFSWKVLGVEGDTGFVEGRTDYREGRAYANLWVIELDEAGRARRFTEWYMRRPGS
ncbi:nuclear transport factor 2 family protein [Protaetiibacter intestinalis]|uniref:Nuclear transport factor 2 family protein n=1 Tax=Protaetiibacter intestinalis TaxID=2419774 RepID=A0A387BED3_9MICO|nr:nuclear transport factor 2 family protein [Protaetiibacter intestinalis]AYF96840.1 nuclear transport factor 2 family protein [Protaetiibacter intestinalis]